MRRVLERIRDRSMLIRIVVSTAFVLLSVVGFAGLLQGDETGFSEQSNEKLKQESLQAARKGEKTMEKATFAAGCFWGVEETFRKLDGVVVTQVGYTGGKTEDPTYKEVCSDRTGHAEAVEVEFDPKVISYGELLKAFWNSHDPTTPNRQGPDVGSQYRSAIFYHTPEQKEAAEASKEALNASEERHGRIVTEIVPAKEFYRAEEYHQKYLMKRGVGQCHI